MVKALADYSRKKEVAYLKEGFPDPETGEIVNPDGIRNQTEGGILQSISWTLYEQVTFDRT